jgi:hypothetical protein
MLKPNLHYATCRLLQQELARGPSCNEQDFSTEQQCGIFKGHTVHTPGANPEKAAANRMVMIGNGLTRTVLDYGPNAPHPMLTLDELAPPMRRSRTLADRPCMMFAGTKISAHSARDASSMPSTVQAVRAGEHLMCDEGIMQQCKLSEESMHGWETVSHAWQAQLAEGASAGGAAPAGAGAAAQSPAALLAVVEIQAHKKACLERFEPASSISAGQTGRAFQSSFVLAELPGGGKDIVAVQWYGEMRPRDAELQRTVQPIRFAEVVPLQAQKQDLVGIDSFVAKYDQDRTAAQQPPVYLALQKILEPVVMFAPPCAGVPQDEQERNVYRFFRCAGRRVINRRAVQLQPAE